MKENRINEKRKTDYRVEVALGVFVILHIIFAVYLGIQKINYHYDEWLTFGLANNTMGGVDLKKGKIYHGFSLYNDYLSVKNSERFDYGDVWKNQAKDVHPPFYYVIIHTICSVFPEQFSKWFGIVPNIFFMIWIDFLFFRLAKCILKDDWLALVTTLAAGTNLLAMNMVIFIRMYEMMTFFIIGISLLFAVYFNKEKDWKFYIGTYLLSVGGTMTQYYFLIYLFFLCLFFGIRLLMQRKWRVIFRFITTFFVAGISCIVIFPAMIVQIFGGSTRGKQAFSAIHTLHNYGKYLKIYGGILNANVFGGLSFGILFIFVLLMILMIYKKGWKNCAKEIVTVPGMLLFAGILYTMLIAKIAPYRTERYVMPVGWIFILFSVWFIYKGITTVVDLTRKGWITGAIFVMLLFMAVNSLRMSDWKYKYTYQKNQYQLDIAEKYKNCSVVYVYKIRSRTACNAEELKKYKDYVFVKPGELEKLIAETNMDRMILYVANSYEEESIIDTILKTNSQLGNVSFLFKSRYANVYYIE